MARSIEEINKEIEMVDKAIKDIKATKENRGQYSSGELAQMYALDPKAAEFFANKQAQEVRKTMSPDESRRQLRISMNDSYAAMNNDKLSDTDRKIAKKEYDIYLNESEKETPSTQNAAAAIAEMRRSFSGGNDSGNNIDASKMLDYNTAVSYIKSELSDEKFPTNNASYQKRVGELVTASNSLGSIDAEKIKKDIDAITALKPKSTENQDTAWAAISKILSVDKNGKSTTANIDKALTELELQKSKLNLTAEDIRVINAKIEDSRPKPLLRRPKKTSEEIAKIVNGHLANVIKWALANTLNPSNAEDRLLLAKIKSRGFANEAYMSDDASLSKDVITQAIQKLVNVSSLPIDAANRFKQTIPKQYNDAVAGVNLYLSEKYKDKVSEALFDNAKLILGQSAQDFAGGTGAGKAGKLVETTTTNGITITRIRK